MTKARFNFSFGATGTVLTLPSNENGWIEKVIVSVPNFTNAPTATLSITDDEGFILYTGSAINNNTTSTVGDQIGVAEYGSVPLDYGYNITITLSGVAGGTGGTVQVRAYMKNMGRGE